MALKSLHVPNDIVFSDNSTEAINFPEERKTYPFLIISDYNMPTLNGLELKRYIDGKEKLKRKGIHFILMMSSEEEEEEMIKAAYSAKAHGYFHKTSDFDTLTKNLKVIVDYWTFCLVPASY